MGILQEIKQNAYAFIIKKEIYETNKKTIANKAIQRTAKNAAADLLR